MQVNLLHLPLALDPLTLPSRDEHPPNYTERHT